MGSFLPGHQQEHKKQRTEPAAAVVSPAPTPVHTMTTQGFEVSYGGVNPILTTTSIHGDSSGALNPIPGFGNSASENKSSSDGEESEDHSPSL